MKAFMGCVDKITKCLERLAGNKERIKQLAGQRMRATSTEEEKKISEQVEELLTQNEQTRTQIDQQFKAMKEDIQKTASENAKEADELPEYRMKRQILSAILAKAQEELVRTNEARAEFQAVVKDKFRGQLKACNRLRSRRRQPFAHRQADRGNGSR